MVEMIVNVDLYTWTTPVERQTFNGPSEDYHTAPRGSTISVSDAEAKRGGSLMVRRHYAGAGGGTVSRDEPALISAATVEAVAADQAEAAARIPSVEANLAALRIKAMGQPLAPPVVTATPVVLPPSITGVNHLGSIDGEGRPVGVGAAPTGPDEARLRSLKVEDLLAHLNQHPEDVDTIERLEAERKEPRVSVTRAVDLARSKGE